jgi:hypothetical protein
LVSNATASQERREQGKQRTCVGERVRRRGKEYGQRNWSERTATVSEMVTKQVTRQLPLPSGHFILVEGKTH